MELVLKSQKVDVAAQRLLAQAVIVEIVLVPDKLLVVRDHLEEVLQRLRKKLSRVEL